MEHVQRVLQRLKLEKDNWLLASKLLALYIPAAVKLQEQAFLTLEVFKWLCLYSALFTGPFFSYSLQQNQLHVFTNVTDELVG